MEPHLFARIRVEGRSPSLWHGLVNIIAVHALAGPYAAAAVLLATAGLVKAGRPTPTVGALRALRLPSRPWLVRALGVMEASVGATALAFDSQAAAAMVAASYAAFAGFVLLALRRGAMVGTCGCFGRADTPPTLTHLVINAGAAAVATGIAVRPSGTSFAATVGDQPLLGIPFTLLCLTCAALAYLAFTRLAQLEGLRNRA